MQIETTRRIRERRSKMLVGAIVLAGIVGVAGAARADTSAENKAAAEALFRQGKDLMARGQLAQACEKLANSQQIDPAVGTLLNLGDCYEKIGRLASAWATFNDAAASAKAAAQADREAAARSRAAALEPRLPQLVVNVPADSSSISEVKRDGTVVLKGVWGAPLPVDPGEHLIEASGPGKKPWSQRVVATEAKTVTVAVPVLAAEVAAIAASVPAPVAAQPAPAPPQAVPAPPPAEPAPPPAKQPAAKSGGGIGGQKIGALAVGGAGIVALGVASVITLSAKSKYNAADCSAGGCTESGFNDRQSAVSAARTATIVSVIGGVAVAGGVVLWLTAGSSKEAKVGLSPIAGPNAAGLSMRGAW
jgi:hypothetical protein